jgi:outer membrane immunogenic protein
VTDVDWFGTARGRLGYAVGNALIYGTGGLAYGQVNSHIENSTTYTVSNTNTGWTAGAGVEYRFTSAISAKAEYLYVNLGWTPEPLSMKSYTDFGVARIGLNYTFGGP